MSYNEKSSKEVSVADHDERIIEIAKELLVLVRRHTASGATRVQAGVALDIAHRLYSVAEFGGVEDFKAALDASSDRESLSTA